MKHTAFFSMFNHRVNTDINTNKLASSINHSLRLMNDFDKPNSRQFDINSTRKTYLIYKNNELNLHEISDEKKEEIKTEILSKFDTNLDENLSKKLASDLANSRTKLKKFGGIFKEISEIKNQEISENQLDDYIKTILNDDEISRKNQKIQQLKKFVEISNLIQENEKKDKRKATYQEFIFKIPTLEIDVLTSQDYIDLAQSFYKENFKEYSIDLTFFHADETYENDNNKTVGDHVHLFVNCQNSETKNIDLLDKQKQLVIDYIVKNRDKYQDIDDDILNDLKNDYSFKSNQNKSAEIQKHNSKIRLLNKISGTVKQDIMFDFYNKKLEKYGIEIEKNEYITEEEQSKKLDMQRTSKIKKSDRNFNYEQAKLKEFERNIKRNEKLLKEQSKKLDEISVKTLENIAKSKEEHYKQIEEIKNLDNYNTHKSNKLFEKIIDKVEDVLKVSILVNTHKKLINLSEKYKDLFESLKDFYFDKYKEIKKKKHHLDLTDENKIKDKMKRYKLQNLSKYRNNLIKKYENLELLDFNYNQIEVTKKYNKDLNDDEILKVLKNEKIDFMLSKKIESDNIGYLDNVKIKEIHYILDDSSNNIDNSKLAFLTLNKKEETDENVDKFDDFRKALLLTVISKSKESLSENDIYNLIYKQSKLTNSQKLDIQQNQEYIDNRINEYINNNSFFNKYDLDFLDIEQLSYNKKHHLEYEFSKEFDDYLLKKQDFNKFEEREISENEFKLNEMFDYFDEIVEEFMLEFNLDSNVLNAQARQDYELKKFVNYFQKLSEFKDRKAATDARYASYKSKFQP